MENFKTKLLSKGYLFFWGLDQLFGRPQYLPFKKIRTKISNKINEYGKGNVQYKEHKNIYVSRLDKQALQKNLGDVPIVFKRIINKNSLSHLTFNDLEKKFGHIDQAFSDSEKYYFNGGKLKLSDLLQEIQKSNPKASLAFGDLVHKYPEFLKYIQMNELMDLDTFKGSINKTWQIFGSGLGKWTKLHSELGNLLSFQIIGKKKWVIFSHKETTKIDPQVNWRMYLESNTLGNCKDFQNIPVELDVYVVELEPGDVLYCPSFFWHFVWADEPTFSLAFKWTSIKTLLLHPFLSFVVLTSRYPTILSKMPFFRKVGEFHPPLG